MARRSKEELIAEIKKAYQASKVLLEIQLEDEPEYGMQDLAALPEIDGWISRCREGGATYSEILAGVIEHVNGFLTFARTAKHPEELARIHDHLARYKAKTGHDLLTQFSDPLKVVKAILRTGKINTETDYRIVMEILNDVGNAAFDDAQLAKLESAAAAFEDAYAGPA